MRKIPYKLILGMSVVALFLMGCQEKEPISAKKLQDMIDNQAYSEVVKRLKRLNEDSFTDSLIYYRALAYGNLGQFRNALEDFNRVIEINPNYKRAYINRAKIHQMFSRYSDARENLTMALGEDSLTSSEAYHLFALLEIKEHNNSLKSIDYLKKAIDLNPQNKNAYIILTYLSFQEKSHTDEELYYINKALELEESAEVYFLRSRWYQLNEDFDMALKDINSSISLDSSFADGYLFRGKIKLMMDPVKDSYNAFNDIVIARNLGNEEARDLVEQLRIAKSTSTGEYIYGEIIFHNNSKESQIQEPIYIDNYTINLENEELDDVTNAVQEVNEIEAVRQEVKRLYNELLTFKDNRDFHNYGFGRGYKYYHWMEEIEDIVNKARSMNITFPNFAIGDIEILGLEYMKSKGKETDYSRWVRNRVEKDLY